MRDASTTELAYCAGFFDGEGCVHIDEVNLKGHARPAWRMAATVSQDDPAPLRLFLDIWGGSVRARRPRPNGKQGHVWVVSALGAAKFMTDVRPWCLVKGPAIDVALRYQATIHNGSNRPGRGGLTDAQVDERRALRGELRRANGTLRD